MMFKINFFILILLILLSFSNGEQCGSQAGGALCPNNLCCSEYGWCGSTADYCGPGCQSGPCWGTTPPPPPATPSPPPPPVIPSPPPPPGTADITDVISLELFKEMLRHRGDSPCEGAFYTYEAFVEAARYFPGFGTTGDYKTKAREVAAFFGQTSQETTGGWEEAPGGKFAWEYCFVTERSPADYCVPSVEWPCAPGKQYYGRGPIQISYNYNYGQAGKALNLNLLEDPDLVARDPVVAFKTAIWFWMTPQSPKPSSHDVIIGVWIPTNSDVAAGRLPGYGVITNIINGGVECGHGFDDKVSGRIGFYHRSCEKLKVSMGNNLVCYNQTRFSVRLPLRISALFKS